MLESPWGAIAAICAGGAALSLLLEMFLTPRPAAVWRRPPACMAIHLGLWLLAFALAFALLRRPLFAASVVLSLLLLIVLVNNAKFHSLREPFICQDFEYFTDAVRHPRLYIPFLGLRRLLLAIAAFSGALAAGWLLEAPVTAVMASGDFFIGCGAIALAGGAMLWIGARGCPAARYEPALDMTRLGLLASLWRYGLDERRDIPSELRAGRFAATPRNASGELPDFIVVQSESFFDARRCFAGIRPQVLPQFDALKASAVAHGLLSVPAWGANTVRTEFAFLSGLPAPAMGVHRFNPYRKLARQGLPTLAGFLKRLGYRTVCVHPYPASFYCRDKVFPLLGFDEFVDLRQFDGAERVGPYVGDAALAMKVREIAETHRRQSDRPVFIFVITMENHGPLHLEQIGRDDAERFYSSAPPAGCEDLTIYLRHLANADRMISLLRGHLEASAREAWLCLFGDHVPIMPTVYRELGEPGGETDYVMWTNCGSRAAATAAEMRVEDLGWLLLREAGLVEVAMDDIERLQASVVA